MLTLTQQPATVLDEAAAIVQAEWMRHRGCADCWESPVAAEMPAELPARQQPAARVGVYTTSSFSPPRPRPAAAAVEASRISSDRCRRPGRGLSMDRLSARRRRRSMM